VHGGDVGGDLFAFTGGWGGSFNGFGGSLLLFLLLLVTSRGILVSVVFLGLGNGFGCRRFRSGRYRFNWALFGRGLSLLLRLGSVVVRVATHLFLLLL